MTGVLTLRRIPGQRHTHTETTTRGHREGTATHKPKGEASGETSPADVWTQGFQPPELQGNIFPLLFSHVLCGVSLGPPKATDSPTQDEEERGLFVGLGCHCNPGQQHRQPRGSGLAPSSSGPLSAHGPVPPAPRPRLLAVLTPLPTITHPEATPALSPHQSPTRKPPTSLEKRDSLPMTDLPSLCLKLVKDAENSRRFHELVVSRQVGKGQDVGC